MSFVRLCEKTPRGSEGVGGDVRRVQLIHVSGNVLLHHCELASQCTPGEAHEL